MLNTKWKNKNNVANVQQVSCISVTNMDKKNCVKNGNSLKKIEKFQLKKNLKKLYQFNFKYSHKNYQIVQ